MSIIDDARALRAQMESIAQYAPDAVAAQAKALYPQWASYTGKALAAGTKVRYDGRLYKAAQAVSQVLESQPPSQDTAALYVAIDEAHAGTQDDPIPAVAGMEYIHGKYYSDGGKTYQMTRQGMQDGETVVLQYLPSQLVGQYFEEVAA